MHPRMMIPVREPRSLCTAALNPFQRYFFSEQVPIDTHSIDPDPAQEPRSIFIAYQC